MRFTALAFIIGLSLPLAACEDQEVVEPASTAQLGVQVAPIVGGEDASPGQAPSLVSIQSLTGAHRCGGSLLSANRVLTAAHCVDGASPSQLRVVAGLYQRSDTAGTQSALVSSIVVHASYNQGSGTFPNDIAILRLATAIPEDSGVVEYATLPADDNNDFVGQSCTVYGWGRTAASSALPNTLQFANMSVLAATQCNSQLLADVGPGATNALQICAAESGIVACSGDGGGPLVCGNVLAGVVSWGIYDGGPDRACNAAFPSVYTRTSKYLQWIADNI